VSITQGTNEFFGLKTNLFMMYHHSLIKFNNHG